MNQIEIAYFLVEQGVGKKITSPEILKNENLNCRIFENSALKTKSETYIKQQIHCKKL